MNIKVTNLDLGYTQCEDLNTLARVEGEKLIGDLSTNVNNLKAHWKGSDACENIKRLINVYNAMVSIVTDAKSVTSAAGSAISAIQEVRRANGGAGNVGALLPGNAPESSVLSAPEATTEYYCDPAAKDDDILLGTILENYEKFQTAFTEQKNELLLNWTAGANREKAVETFNKFDENALTYKNVLTAVKTDLDTAVSNIAQLG